MNLYNMSIINRNERPETRGAPIAVFRPITNL